MTDVERIVKIKKLASELNLRIHLASMDFSDKKEEDITDVKEVLGIVFVDNLTTNDLAFYFQQNRFNDERTK